MDSDMLERDIGELKAGMDHLKEERDIAERGGDTFPLIKLSPSHFFNIVCLFSIRAIRMQFYFSGWLEQTLSTFIVAAEGGEDLLTQRLAMVNSLFASTLSFLGDAVPVPATFKFLFETLRVFCKTLKSSPT